MEVRNNTIAHDFGPGLTTVSQVEAAKVLEFVTILQAKFPGDMYLEEMFSWVSC